MNIFRKWDLWYWVLGVIFIAYKTAYGPENLFSGTFLYWVMVIGLYLVLKVIQMITKK